MCPAWYNEMAVYPVTAAADMPPDPTAMSREAKSLAGVVRHVMATCRVVAGVGRVARRASPPTAASGADPVAHAAVRVLIKLWRLVHKSLKALQVATPQSR